ncbi:MAG: hypothetical protein I3275_04830 [Candidatus Moeniiplasma glomeromycotorum]|nr:hypothetical protein [Candidatus Moeniiplasma glomeromycotorum]
MRSKEKIRKFFNLIKNLFRILWVVIFFHWIFWATTYARAPQYYEVVKDKEGEITRHTQKSPLYRGKGWLGKLVENKSNEATIDEIEEDIIGQIEAETGKNNLTREKTQRLPELEKLSQEIEALEKKVEKSETEKQKLEQKRKDYQEKFELFKEKTLANIQKHLNENKINITELNDRREWRGQLFLDPLKFFLITPLNQTCKAFGILGHPGTLFFLAEIIFKIAAVKLICLGINYPESIGEKIQENYQKIQNPQLSLEEREQSQREVASLFKYQLLNITLFFLPWFIFLHPAHLDKTSGHFSKSLPFPYLLVPLLIIPILLSFLSAELLRLGRMVKGKEIKDYLVKHWLMISFIFIFSALWAAQNWGNYWWILFGFGIDFLFNLIRIMLFRTKTESHSGTFKVTRVRIVK